MLRKEIASRPASYFNFFPPLFLLVLPVVLMYR